MAVNEAATQESEPLSEAALACGAASVLGLAYFSEK
jgi:hypothetical protein